MLQIPTTLLVMIRREYLRCPSRWQKNVRCIYPVDKVSKDPKNRKPKPLPNTDKAQIVGKLNVSESADLWPKLSGKNGVVAESRQSLIKHTSYNATMKFLYLLSSSWCITFKISSWEVLYLHFGLFGSGCVRDSQSGVLYLHFGWWLYNATRSLLTCPQSDGSASR